MARHDAEMARTHVQRALTAAALSALSSAAAAAQPPVDYSKLEIEITELGAAALIRRDTSARMGYRSLDGGIESAAAQ
jgi:hypothetical protein